MAAGQIHMVVTADEAQALDALRRLDTQQQKVVEKFKTMGTTARGAHKEVADGMSEGARHATDFALKLVGITSAVAGIMAVARALRAEYENLKQRQAEAAMTQTTVAEARSLALLNLPSTLPAAQLDRMVRAAGAQTGLQQSILWQGLPGPLSAMGSATPAQFESALNLTARLRKTVGPGMDMSSMMGGLMDVMKATGTGDAKQALGWVRQVGTTARVEDVREQIQNLVPVLQAAREFGAGPEEAAELWTYLTQAAGDIQGRKSATGAITLMRALASKDILPSRVSRRGKVSFATSAVPGGAFAERLTNMQQWWGAADEGLRREFIQNLGAEAKMAGPIQGLISGSPQAMRDLAAAQAGVGAPGAPGLGGLIDQYFAETQMFRGQPISEMVKSLAGLQEQLQAESPEALAGAMRENLPKLLRAAGVSATRQKALMALWELDSGLGTGDALGASLSAIGIVKERIGAPTIRTLRPKAWRTGGAGDYGAIANPDYVPGAAEALTKIADLLENMNDGMTIKGDTRPKQHGGSNPQGE